MEEIIDDLTKDLNSLNKNDNVSIDKIYQLKKHLNSMKTYYENQIDEMITNMENMRIKQKKELDDMNRRHDSEINEILNKNRQELQSNKHRRIKFF
jgi:ATP phosphoribosyltransferase